MTTPTDPTPAYAPSEHPWAGCTCLGCGAPIDEDGYCSAHRGDVEEGEPSNG